LNKARYYIAAITAYTLWGFFSLALEPIHEYAAYDILFHRVFGCAMLMLIIVFLFRRDKLRNTFRLIGTMPPKKRIRTIWLNIAGSVFLTGNWFSFIYAMIHISVKSTSLAYLVCPILTTLLAFFILREKLHSLQWLAVAMSIIGCLLLGYGDLKDMLFSLIIGFSYACYLVSQRMNSGLDTFIVLTFHIVLSSLFLLPFYFINGTGSPAEFTFYIYIAVIAVFLTIIPLFLNLYALTGLNSSVVGMLLNINPIIGFTLATWVFHESNSPLQIAAYGIIFLAVIVFNGKEIFKWGKKPVNA
jgi:chloramphenicol-sensitive protein RarD